MIVHIQELEPLTNLNKKKSNNKKSLKFKLGTDLYTLNYILVSQYRVAFISLVIIRYHRQYSESKEEEKETEQEQKQQQALVLVESGSQK